MGMRRGDVPTNAQLREWRERLRDIEDRASRSNSTDGRLTYNAARYAGTLLDAEMQETVPT